MKKNKCMICGKEFESERHARICSTRCRTIRKEEMKREQRERQKNPVTQNPQKRQSKITEINEAARAVGMTYGKYVAMKYAEKNRI